MFLIPALASTTQLFLRKLVSHMGVKWFQTFVVLILTLQVTSVKQNIFL